MTQDYLDAIEYGLLTIAKGKKTAKVEEVRMPEWTDTYGRKWKIEIKKENDEQ
jgi:hypothetical protein